MITKFKIFENSSENKIELKNNYFWWIRGNYNDIIRVLIELNKYDLKTIYHEFTIKYVIEFEFLDKFDFIGLFLFLEEGSVSHVSVFKYWLVENNKKRQSIIHQSIINNFEFKGELKLKEGKLILDPLEAETIKYNL